MHRQRRAGWRAAAHHDVDEARVSDSLEELDLLDERVVRVDLVLYLLDRRLDLRVLGHAEEVDGELAITSSRWDRYG